MGSRLQLISEGVLDGVKFNKGLVHEKMFSANKDFKYEQNAFFYNFVG
jgi:hypothetical protein